MLGFVLRTRVVSVVMLGRRRGGPELCKHDPWRPHPGYFFFMICCVIRYYSGDQVTDSSEVPRAKERAYWRHKEEQHKLRSAGVRTPTHFPIELLVSP